MSEREERKAYLLSIPWVRELAFPVPCEGLKQSKIALKHLYSMGGRPPEGIPDRARCKRLAHYHYTAGRGREDYGKTGNYCWSHVVSMLNDDYARYDRWRQREAKS